jgi:hypothetical protein
LVIPPEIGAYQVLGEHGPHRPCPSSGPHPAGREDLGKLPFSCSWRLSLNPVDFGELSTGGGLSLDLTSSSKHRGSVGGLVLVLVGSPLGLVDCGMMFIMITIGPGDSSIPGMVS